MTRVSTPVRLRHAPGDSFLVTASDAGRYDVTVRPVTFVYIKAHSVVPGDYLIPHFSARGRDFVLECVPQGYGKRRLDIKVRRYEGSGDGHEVTLMVHEEDELRVDPEMSGLERLLASSAPVSEGLRYYVRRARSTRACAPAYGQFNSACDTTGAWPRLDQVTCWYSQFREGVTGALLP